MKKVRFKITAPIMFSAVLLLAACGRSSTAL